MTGNDPIDRRRLLAVTLGAAAFFMTGPALADDDDDHDKAYLLRDRGDFRPLPEILERLTGDLPEGHEILSMELERKGEFWVYEFRVIDDAGRRYETLR